MFWNRCFRYVSGKFPLVLRIELVGGGVRSLGGATGVYRALSAVHKASFHTGCVCRD